MHGLIYQLAGSSIVMIAIVSFVVSGMIGHFPQL